MRASSGALTSTVVERPLARDETAGDAALSSYTTTRVAASHDCAAAAVRYVRATAWFASKLAEAVRKPRTTSVGEAPGAAARTSNRMSSGSSAATAGSGLPT